MNNRVCPFSQLYCMIYIDRMKNNTTFSVSDRTRKVYIRYDGCGDCTATKLTFSPISYESSILLTDNVGSADDS